MAKKSEVRGGSRWRRHVSEVMFRSTVVSFCRHYWKLKLRPGSVIPEGPCFIYGNHSNNYDAFMINAFTSWGKGTGGVMTMEYLDDHFLAPFFSSIGVVGTRKHVPEPGLIRQIFKLLDRDLAVVIYPEGGRRWDGRPAPWIESTAKLFRNANVPVHPILIHGSYVAWPRWARYPRPAHLEIEVLPAVPLDRSLPLDEALMRLREPIAFDENEVADAIRPRTAFHPAVGIERLLYRDPYTGVNGGIRVLSGDRISCAGGAWTATVLPDSRIRREDTGDTLLTGDLYEQLKKLPYDYGNGRAALSNRVSLHGNVGDEVISSRAATVSLLASHLSIAGTKKYHVPIEDARFVSTERNDKLVLTLSNGRLSMHFRYGGSALQWFDELHRMAPNMRF